MSDISADEQLRAELAFFGRMTASVTHEINNCIAIIGQVSGLLQDLCYSAQQGHPVELDKLCSNSQKVGGQVARIQEIVKRLNRFAHSVDNAVVCFNPCDTVHNLVDLCQRFASNRGVTLTMDGALDAVAIEGDPFCLQQAVFLCIDLAMEASRDGGSVNVAVISSGSGITITVVSSGPLSSDNNKLSLALLECVVNKMGGSAVLPHKGAEEHEFRLEFPGKIGAA